MTDILAVPPHAGRVIHLCLPGYQPSPKRRSVGDDSALCGALISRCVRIPLADALDIHPTGTDPRPSWRWCRVCVGHAADIHGLVDQVLAQIAAGGAP